MLSDLSLAAWGALTERAARLSCECDTAGEWGAGTGDGDWGLGALWMKSQSWAEMSAAPVHDDACSLLLLLLRGGPWGRELIRNVVIRILAWSKIRKTGGALRRRRARAPGPTPADPVSVRYEAYHSKLVRYYCRTLGARWCYGYMLLAFSTAQPVRYNRTIVPPWFVTLVVCEKEPESGPRTNGPLAEVEKDEKGRQDADPHKTSSICALCLPT
jgi:hypothetical protein